MQPTKSEIRRQIGMIKYRKALISLQGKENMRCISAYFTTCYLDMFLLPLYYAWKILGYGNMQEVRMETYLKQIYSSFVNDARVIISDMIQLLVDEKCPVELLNHTMQQSLLRTFNRIEKTLF